MNANTNLKPFLSRVCANVSFQPFNTPGFLIVHTTFLPQATYSKNHNAYCKILNPTQVFWRPNVIQHVIKTFEENKPKKKS